MKQYRKKAGQTIFAQQIHVSLPGFTYEKWGGTQTAKPGDWIVVNAGEFYTVDGEVFAATYSIVRPGIYMKTAVVWAMEVEAGGKVQTKEGFSDCCVGDFIVSNDENGYDSYPVRAVKFWEMYEPMPLTR